MYTIKQLLLSPPVAFVIYIGIAGLVIWFGKKLAGPANQTEAKLNTYSSGEAPPTDAAAPGYKPFFFVALFFAILHLGILVLGTSEYSGATMIYLIGLIIALAAMILG